MEWAMDLEFKKIAGMGLLAVVTFWLGMLMMTKARGRFEEVNHIQT